MTKKGKISIALTVLGGVGVALTAYFAAKDSRKYDVIKSEAEYKKDKELTDEEFAEIMEEQECSNPSEVNYFTKKEQAIIFFKGYWRTLLVGSATIGCNVAAQVIDLKEIAVLTGTVGYLASQYKRLDRKFQDMFPEEYKAVRKAMTEDAIKEKEDNYISEGTYDGRYAIYEPITRTDGYSKLEPEKLALECTNFINSGLLNDQVVSLFDYISFLQFATGDKKFSPKPWMHKIGWSLDDDAYLNTCSYDRNGFAMNVEVEQRTLKDGSVVNSLDMLKSPFDFSEELMELYDIPR